MQKLKHSQMLLDRRAYLLNKKDLDEDRDLCLICLEVALNPQECCTCKSTFCFACSSHWRNISGQCPKKCTKNTWRLVPRPHKNIYLKCPYSEKCVYATLWENWENHLGTCAHMPEHMKQYLKLKNSYKCENGHTLMPDCEVRKCSDCQENCKCLSVCPLCDKRYCKKCRLPKLHKKLCPNQHKYTKFPKPSFECDKCNRGFVEKNCYEDEECKINICEGCMAGLPNYQNEKELMRMFNLLRKYSVGNINF